jgi:hypothetical protein
MNGAASDMAVGLLLVIAASPALQWAVHPTPSGTSPVPDIIGTQDFSKASVLCFLHSCLYPCSAGHVGLLDEEYVSNAV